MLTWPPGFRQRIPDYNSNRTTSSDRTIDFGRNYRSLDCYTNHSFSCNRSSDHIVTNRSHRLGVAGGLLDRLTF